VDLAKDETKNISASQRPQRRPPSGRCCALVAATPPLPHVHYSWLCAHIAPVLASCARCLVVVDALPPDAQHGTTGPNAKRHRPRERVVPIAAARACGCLANATPHVLASQRFMLCLLAAAPTKSPPWRSRSRGSKRDADPSMTKAR
jgi:hypothetical protein